MWISYLSATKQGTQPAVSLHGRRRTFTLKCKPLYEMDGVTRLIRPKLSDPPTTQECGREGGGKTI
jgi:hypothetical protein